MFYNKNIKLYELQQGKDEWGAMVESSYKYIKNMLVDIQPYSRDKLKRDYGYDLETTKRLFCDTGLGVKESSLITYRDKPFHVVKIVEWDDYLDIALIDAVGVDLNG